MKKKFLSVVSLLLIGSIILTGCSKKEEEQVESEITAVSSVSLTETVDWYVGDSFNVNDIASITDETKVVTDMQFVDSTGTMQTDFVCSEVGSYSMAILVTFEDGTQEMPTYVFNVLENTEVAKELPTGWEQLINSKEYTLEQFNSPKGDILFYLKPNINVMGQESVVGWHELFYNETDKLSYGMYYTDEYVNPITGMVDLMSSLASEVMPKTEEEFKERVASGDIELENPEMTFEEYTAEFNDTLNTAFNIFKVEAAKSTIGEWEVVDDIVYTDASGFVDGVDKIFMGRFSYTELPQGGYLVLSVSPLTEPSPALSVTEEQKVSGEKVQVPEEEIKAWNEVAAEMDKVKNAANLVANDSYGNITKVDLAWWEPVVEEPVEEEAPVTAIVTPIEPETEGESQLAQEVKAERPKTYQEKYPTLYTWPDQQAIYGMNPKLLVYDLLSASDSSGKVSYENCLIPIWGVNEHKFLNAMAFASGSNNRQNASTTVTPSASSSSSGLFGNTTQSGNTGNSGGSGEASDPENIATLKTSFGTFEVVGNSGLTVDTAKSSKAQISIKTFDDEYYRIISTTAASIEKSKTKPMYDIEGLNPNTWQCVKGASETVPMGTITRYYVTYETDDGVSHTAEYFYVISTGSGYLMIMPDEAVTTTSSTMYNICKMVREN